MDWPDEAPDLLLDVLRGVEDVVLEVEVVALERVRRAGWPYCWGPPYCCIACAYGEVVTWVAEPGIGLR